MAIIQFDATQVAPDPGRGDPVPAGWYIVALEKSEMKPTADGNGNFFLECVYGILDGQFKGRKLFDRFNLRNASPQAQEIAYRQFAAVCHAVGHLQVGDSSELHGRPMKARVKIEPEKKNPDGTVQYEAKNAITSYKNVNDTSAVNTAAAPAPAAMPAVAMPPPAAPGGWAPPAATQPWAPPAGAPAAAPAQQPWAPPPQVPAGPPPGWQPPAAAPVAQPPAWQPPAGAPAQQPWQQAQPPAQQPPAVQAPVQPPPGMAPAWSPPPAGPGAVPPWQK